MRQKIIDAEDMVADISGDVFKMSKSELATVAASWTATDNPSGSLILRYSPDYTEAAGASAATWINVQTFDTNPDASGAGSTAEPFRGMAGWFQLFYDMTADGDAAYLTAWVEISDVR